MIILLVSVVTQTICGQQCLMGQSEVSLSSGYSSSYISNSGAVIWSFDRDLLHNSINKYVASGNLWLGGFDERENLRVAAVGWLTTTGSDYYPGPLDPDTGFPYQVDCGDWDRIWKVTRADIEAHRIDYMDGRIDNPRTAIYAWPGRASEVFADFNSFELPADVDLAPYADLNGNGIYEPDLGEYPEVPGDEACWFVINDSGGPHNASLGTPLQAEVQVLVYVYESSLLEVALTTFAQVTVINRGAFDLKHAIAGLNVIPNLPCYDHTFGIDTIRDIVFGYGIDETPCHVGTGDLDTAYIAMSLIDGPQPQGGIAKFMTYDRINQITSAPRVPEEYYNYMSGFWKNDIPWTFGGSGYNPGSVDTVDYLYPGNPIDSTAWSMCTTGLPYDDRRVVMSLTPVDLPRGSSMSFTYAMTYGRNISSSCQDMEPVLARLEELQNYGQVVSSIEPASSQWQEVFIHPNPAHDVCMISATPIPIRRVALCDIGGRCILDRYTDQHTIDVADLSTGVYLVTIELTDGSRIVERLLVK